MSVLSHEDAYSELAAVALDAAPVDLSSAVREHAAVCPQCGPELVAMEETVAELAQAIPNRVMNLGHAAGIRSRLLMRARGEREARSAPGLGRPDLTRGVASLTGLGHKLTPGSQRAVDEEVKRVAPPERSRIRLFSGAGLLAMAASVAFVVAGLQLARVTSDRNRLREALAVRGTPTPRADTARQLMPEKDALVAAMAGPDVRIVPLANKGTTRMGRVFWNRASNDWTMVVYTMPRPKPGMTYQLWLVTDSAKISAGTFAPDSTGKAFMQAKYVLDRHALKAIAVTEEPAGGMPSPTGSIVASGSATLQ